MTDEAMSRSLMPILFDQEFFYYYSFIISINHSNSRFNVECSGYWILTKKVTRAFANAVNDE